MADPPFHKCECGARGDDGSMGIMGWHYMPDDRGAHFWRERLCPHCGEYELADNTCVDYGLHHLEGEPCGDCEDVAV